MGAPGCRALKCAGASAGGTIALGLTPLMNGVEEAGSFGGMGAMAVPRLSWANGSRMNAAKRFSSGGRAAARGCISVSSVREFAWRLEGGPCWKLNCVEA